MASKYEITKNAAEWLKTEVLASQPKYLAFLRTAANNYKYNFVEQLLIHEQKPDATACAGIDVWNRLGRWVNKGTHGIALLDTSSPQHRLRYVFDISDTNSYAGRTVSIWQMEFRHELAVMEALSDSFGIAREQMESFPEFLEKAAEVLVEDNITDYLRDLTLNTKGSLLEDLDELNIEVELRRTMRSSITYMLLTRCGYDPSIYEDYLDFSHIRDFDTPDVATILGNAVSDVSEMALREIGVTVRALEKAERTSNRTFAEKRISGYDVTGKANNQPVTERSEQHDQPHLHAEGRLPDPRSGSPGSPENREVRNDAPSVPAGLPSGDLRRDAPEGDSERALGADRPTGQRDGGAPGIAGGTGGGRDGASESDRSDGLGASDERDQVLGGRNRNAGPDLRISEETPPADDELPSEREQQNRIAEAEADRASAFVISQEDIDTVLMGGSHVSEGKFRIYTQLLKQEPAADNIRFLKNEYGIGGAYPAVVGRNISEDHDGKGIRLRLGKITEPDAELLLTWAKVEKRIRELIRDDRYFNQAERENYPVWQRGQAARAERAEIAESFLSVVRDFNDYETQLGNTGVLLNQYVLSSCAQSLTLGEKTTNSLSGNDFILPLMRDALRQIISENTHLTDRCNEVLEALERDVVKPLEPTYDELNPPPEHPKEYQFSLGDTVYLGTQQFAGHLREKRGIYHMILSYTNENGERVTPTKSTGLPVKGNKKRAEAMLNDWRKSEEIALKKRKANGSLKKLDPNQEILFTKFMLDWLEMMKNSVEVTTYASYAQAIKSKINPYFDARFPTLTLSQITPKHIQDYYTWEMTENDVSANTVIHRHANIRKALQYAFKTGLIDINPADRIERPKKVKYVGSTYNDQELEQLFVSVKSEGGLK